MRYHNQDLLDTGNQIIGIEGIGGYTIRQYQQTALEILLEIDRVCKKNDITYFLMYGSLIGAVRHHGFIPWDDDADIILTRENYDRLKKVCQSELSDEYDFISYGDENGSGYTFSRIRKKGTSYIIKSEISRHGRNAGFYIDIMTLDYLSDNKMHAFFQKRSLLALHRLVSPGFCQGVEHLTEFEDVILKILKLLLGKKRTIFLMEKILSSAKEEKSSSVLSNYLIQNRRGMHIFDKKHFTKSEYVPFENTSLPIPLQAITLVNRCYCKGNIANNIFIETVYEDEHEAIIKGDYHRYNDIMFIAQDRERDHHLEVVFDPHRGSDFYDSYYFTCFDKKLNDRCAVRERHYKEKAAKSLAVMTRNEAIARLCCKELILKERMKKIIDSTGNLEEMPLKEVSKVCDELIKLDFAYQKNLTKEEMLTGIYLFLRCSYLPSAYRGFARIQFLYPEDFGEEQAELKNLLEEHMEAYYGIFEGKEKELSGFVQKFSGETYLLAQLIENILLFEKGKYEEAEKGFVDIIDIDENIFLAQYYLGKIYWERDKEGELAVQYLKNSLDTTTYMPLLQMSLDMIEEIERKV